MKHTEAEKLFLEKMAVLNKAFLQFIQCSVKEMPDADLSPSVLDYLKHVEELDRTYGNASNGGTTYTSNNKDKQVEVTEQSTKASLSEKDGGVEQKKREPSAATAFSFNANPAVVPKLSFDVSTTSSVGSEKRGRKRAKKGGPEGDDEEVIISNHNAPTPWQLGNSEKGQIKTASISHSSEVSSLFSSSTTGSILKSSFDSKNDSKTAKEKEDSHEKIVDNVKETDTNKAPLFCLFGEKGDSKKNELQKNPQNFFSTEASSEHGVTDKLDEKNESNGELNGKSHVTPTFSFLKPVMTEGNSGCSDFSKPKLEFSFGMPTSVQSEPDNEGEESEYVPPKPETVLVEEPKAIFSSKCSVFVLKGTEYEKLGIGQLHIKTDETDDKKKILLIRAATTTGTVWLNSYIDESMKHATIEDVKLRISCVSSGTPSTYLLRLPKKEDRDLIVAEIESDNVSS